MDRKSGLFLCFMNVLGEGVPRNYGLFDFRISLLKLWLLLLAL